jgi:hypothetical protein
MKDKLIYFIPLLGIYYCFKYYFREGNRTTIEFFDSEEMVIYHFSVLILLLFIYLKLIL